MLNDLIAGGGLLVVVLGIVATALWAHNAHAVGIVIPAYRRHSDPDVCAEAYDELAYAYEHLSDDDDEDTDDDLPTLDGEPCRVDDAPIAWLLSMPTHTGSGSPAELLMAIHERRESREAGDDHE